ncbi:hypothetical protein K491DRAFT_713797 [Lophiostoma macrostomum CBS 122681]|uniref:Atos-like conserved domain-containing protein n=1 Tax=Lophiostoma macrostomum CBS 122681 TaxID=1314788 RepID=A0A6A6TDZ3_9PLEO|nr:hypothetical protein K491DRAFT_713797 [Lophiostoma macrostomum CBS 122681]
MPIFHDLYETPPRTSVAKQPSSNGPHEASHAGDGPLPTFQSSSQSGNSITFPSHLESDLTSPGGSRKQPVLNRRELIERIKRGNSPSWSHLQNNGTRDTSSPESRPSSRDRPRTPLLPPAELQPSHTTSPDPLCDNAIAGLEIARPRSALHSGDFREKKKTDTALGLDSGSGSIFATSPVAPWHRSFPVTALPSNRGESQVPRDPSSHEHRLMGRSRAVSQSSFSSPFVFMPPTSPLVQASSNTDLDFTSRPGSRQSSRSPERSNRRHTFSPHSFQSFQAAPMARSASGTPAARHLRREGTFPYQAHQPRRSLTSVNQFQPHSSPQTPTVPSRRPSFSSDASPLHLAPMVGSYEESILRGRMSTTPSRPLDFVAQIGVLGKGQCKSNLRCPAHVTVPFPAVFYSYNGGNSRVADNSPSPYVGLVDLENSLPANGDATDSKRKRRHTVPNPEKDELDFRLSSKEDTRSKETIRKLEKRKRRSTSPKAPPGGSYRIPQQGQLQIIIKNPNKTAVKLFLVPYDLSDMEPGQKTFIRQRSYSAGPIIDMPLSSRKNYGTDRPEAALSISDDPNDRPILRYLIHLHMCCPSKGRFFLYKSIRVVFANRVPDGKENLRNEIQLPEPRYSAYRTGRDSLISQSTSSAAATQLAADKAMRRRSAGIPVGHPPYDRRSGSEQHRSRIPPPAVQFTGGQGNRSSSPISALGPIPFNLARMPTLESRPTSRDLMDLDFESPFRSRTNSSPPKHDFGSPSTPAEAFGKLNRGDAGYGGILGSPGTGLLAKKLRSLDVQRDDELHME